MIWATWWIWMIAGLSLAFLEVLVPGYIFLGFALGAWRVLRKGLGGRQGQVKIWDRDINED